MSRLVRVGSAARAAVRRGQHKQLLRGRYPEVARSLDLPPDWTVRRTFTTVGDVAVAEVGATAPEAILKLALTDRGSDALLASCRAVDALSSEPRVDGWADLLPRTLAVGRESGRLVVLERTVVGRDGRDVIAQARDDFPVSTVLGDISSLHRRTGRTAVMDAPLLGSWVDEPVALLEAWLDPTAPPGATGDLRTLLRHGWQGRAVTLSWTHGDLAPGNVVRCRGPGHRGSAEVLARPCHRAQERPEAPGRPRAWGRARPRGGRRAGPPQSPAAAHPSRCVRRCSELMSPTQSRPGRRHVLSPNPSNNSALKHHRPVGPSQPPASHGTGHATIHRPRHEASSAVGHPCGTASLRFWGRGPSATATSPTVVKVRRTVQSGGRSRNAPQMRLPQQPSWCCPRGTHRAAHPHQPEPTALTRRDEGRDEQDHSSRLRGQPGDSRPTSPWAWRKARARSR